MTAKTGGEHEQRSAVESARQYLRTFARFKANARRLLLANTCLNVGLGVFGVLFNLYLVDLHYSLAFVGLVAAATTTAQALISPAMGPLLRRLGAEKTMALGSALMAAAWALSAFSTNAVALTAASAASGLAWSVATIPAAPYMMEHARADERSHLFSAYFASNTIGGMIGSLLSGAVPALVAAMAWARGAVMADRAGLAVGAAITAVAIWLLWTLQQEAATPDSADRPIRPVEETESEETTRRDVLIMLAATGIIAFTMGAIMPFFNVYFAQRLHASTATIGTIYALSGVVCTVAAFLAPLAGRWGRLPGFSAARTLTGPVFALFVLHPGLTVAAAAYMGRNVLGTVSGALENTFAMEVVSARLRPTVASWRSFGFNGAWSVGSLIAGVVVARLGDIAGYDALFLMAGILTIAGSALYYARFARRKNHGVITRVLQRSAGRARRRVRKR